MSQGAPKCLSNFPDYGKTNCSKAYRQLILVCSTSFLQNNQPRDKKVDVVYLNIRNQLDSVSLITKA